MLVRLILGAGLFAMGYYLGREMGRTEYIRDRIEQSRDQPGEAAAEPESGDDETPA